MYQQAQKTYLKNEIEGATKGKLVLLLYDGAIKFINMAVKAIEEKNIVAAHENIIKAENILYELLSTLNMEAGEIAENLFKLYDFAIWQLVEANKTKDVEKLTPVLGILKTLRDAWKEVVTQEELGKQTPNNQQKVDNIKLNVAG
ncbi:MULTISPECIES: flagellar export chaperone FliS [Calditerrivibrio]|jgi:flagellar protein FliS|uniref:Flagellar secretion chaperone FliS n=1 Tax=Calditerrivibrio nitroreducens TaxID=477976 RepID=A0A2J6WRP4_9BACT|nr:MAG: flagellar export chaperone FliS [Calditerrivibrio nitroreducens]